MPAATESNGHNGHKPRRQNLRYATVIIPSTGERVRRELTLSADPLDGDGDAGEQDATPTIVRKSRRRKTLVEQVQYGYQQTTAAVLSFIRSKAGQGTLKCSVAYLLGSLATFLPFLSDWLGHQDGKHVVATVTVYFHPARSIGSMHEATVVAFLAFLYAMFISFTSMGVSIFFAAQKMLFTGHAIVLIFFCGGGLGLIAWIKQRLGNPLVNVACSLASLATITVLTVEGSVQAAKFSEEKVVQVLKMVFLGIAATTLVNLTILPVSARRELSKDFSKTTDLLGDMLVTITRTFLSGSEIELESSVYQQVNKDHRASMNKMKKDLVEAKWEHFFLGTERQHHVEVRLLKCLQRLSQSLGGLRSAASTQFELIRASKLKSVKETPFDLSRSSSFYGSILNPSDGIDPANASLNRIEEEPEDITAPQTVAVSAPASTSYVSSPTISQGNSQGPSPADMFTTFITHLGPPMRSLAYTLKQILDELPFKSGTDDTIAVNENFHTSLESAIGLFKNARREALASLQRNKELVRTKSLERLADVEEIAASCGHFSFALIDFAEDTLAYLDILEDLKVETEASPKHRSWEFLKFWKRRGIDLDRDETRTPPVEQLDEETGQNHKVPELISRADAFANPDRIAERRPWTYQIYLLVRVMRRDDIRFAAKVGLGAAMFALPAFVPAWRPTFYHFRGQWGLVSYMVVCSMTIGASNTTGIERFLGTALGAVFAILAWVIADENPWLLAFFGWLVSIFCFYIIVGKGKGPMGRFIMLTYNLSALYAYSLSVKDDDDDDDEGGVNPEIWEIVLHRVVSVIAGCVWAIIVCRVFWPISARKKLKEGICVLYLRMGLIWKRDPLALFLLGEPTSSYMDIREEAELQSFFSYLESLRKSAQSEFELKGPFEDRVVGRVLERTARMLDNFHAVNVVIGKDSKASPGEAEILRYTRQERSALSARISHLFSVLASSIKMEYPLNDVLPNIENSRDRLLARIFEFRRTHDGDATIKDADYELIYAYVLVTGQLAQDIIAVGHELEEIYGTLNEDNFRLE